MAGLSSQRALHAGTPSTARISVSKAGINGSRQAPAESGLPPPPCESINNGTRAVTHGSLGWCELDEVGQGCVLRRTTCLLVIRLIGDT